MIAIVSGQRESKCSCAIPKIKNALIIPTGSLVSTKNNPTAQPIEYKGLASYC